MNDKALIEKAFEKWAEKHKTGVESKRDEVTAKTAFIAGATWQREQLEADIKKLKEQIREQHKTVGILRENYNIACDEQDKEIREQLIKELRRWIFMEYVPVFDRLVVDKDKLLAKLDLLEREK